MRSLLVSFGALAVATPAHAQFTGGVFPPTVKEGASNAEYRIAADFDGPGGGTDIAQRVHYQASLDDRFQLRGVIATRTVGDDKLDYDFLQAELTWQITPDDRRWQTGLRFDARTRDEGRAEQIGVNWTNQWSFDDGWQARAILLSAVQVADRSNDDIALSGRLQLSKRIDSGQTLGLQYYGDLGTTGRIRAFRRASNVAGPFVVFPIQDGVYIRTGALFGLTDGARDTQLRLWLGKNF